MGTKPFYVSCDSGVRVLVQNCYFGLSSMF